MIIWHFSIIQSGDSSLYIFSTISRHFDLSLYIYTGIQVDTSLQNLSGAVPPPRFLYDKITHLFPHSAANSSCKQFPLNHQKYLPQQFGTIKVSRGEMNSSEAPFQFSSCLIITLFAIFTNSLRFFLNYMPWIIRQNYLRHANSFILFFYSSLSFFRTQNRNRITAKAEQCWWAKQD